MFSQAEETKASCLGHLLLEVRSTTENLVLGSGLFLRTLQKQTASGSLFHSMPVGKLVASLLD